jgi:hypothetical protein
MALQDGSFTCKSEKGGHATALPRYFHASLDSADVLRLPTLGALHNVELNLLTFLQ